MMVILRTVLMVCMKTGLKKEKGTNYLLWELLVQIEKNGLLAHRN